ncbi:unnamed protein product [Ostreobium quekettii]|uniref:FACT complex subunit SSRP1 n=1 Tax=Ostreobium quekettii TaxID=121088 RepID=A0A8S1J3K9_9CHLO|nr:unnamed protein product [Ostreobium quekettii]
MSNGAGPGAASRLAELRAAVGNLASGEELSRALEAEAKSNPALADRIAGLMVAVVREAGAKGTEDQKGASAHQVSLKDARLVLKQVSCQFPRGRHDIGLLESSLGICGSKHDLEIPYTAIEHVAVLENLPNDKKKILVMLALSRRVEIMLGKQKVTSVLMQFNADETLDIADPEDPSSRLQDRTVVVLCQVLGFMGIDPTAFCSPDPEVFQSSRKQPAVSAFFKVNQGLLFLLPSALCFVEKPPIFISHSEIKSVELGRASSMSATFDLIIHLKDGDIVELGQIGTEELQKVLAYITERKIKVGDGADVEEEDSEGAEYDSDDEDDEDFDPEASSDSCGEASARKRKRSADEGPSAAGMTS